MKQFLAKVMENEKMIAIYVNSENPESFIVGKVILVGRSDILAVLYDTKNFPEALCYCNVDTIYRIEQDSLYLRQIQENISTEFAFLEFEEDPWDLFFQVQGQYGNNVCCRLKSGKPVNGKVVEYSKHAVVLLQTKNNKMSEYMIRFNRVEIAMLTVDIPKRGV